MTRPHDFDELGQMRDALLDLERANARERQSRREAEILLEGLRILSDYERREELFGPLLQVLQSGIGFEDAFILVAADAGRLRVVATTSPRFLEVEWPPGPFTRYLSRGRPVALVDPAAVAEWVGLPTGVRAGVRSALHSLLRDEPSLAVLVCTHSQRGFFSEPQLRLAERFAPLAVSALRNLDSMHRLERLNARLQTEITDRKKAEAVAAQTLERISHSSKMAALGEMAGGVAHEINNPLAILSALSSELVELVDERAVVIAGDRAELREIAAEIEATTLRIARIVSGLRSFSREGAGDPFVRVPLRRVIEDTVALCARRLAYADIAFLVDDVAHDLELDCRPSQISQVLLNLLNNAHDAVVRSDSRWIRLSVREHGPMIEIVVTDSGSGIPEVVVKRMFEPFYTTKEVGKGTGLGLSISAGLIAGHGGRLEYDAAFANTRFVLSLPRRQPSRPTTEAV